MSSFKVVKSSFKTIRGRFVDYLSLFLLARLLLRNFCLIFSSFGALLCWSPTLCSVGLPLCEIGVYSDWLGQILRLSDGPAFKTHLLHKLRGYRWRLIWQAILVMKARNIFLFRQAKDFSSTYLLKPDFFKNVGGSRITFVHIRSNLSEAGLCARVIK